MNESRWYHLALVWKKNEVTYYLDGTKAAGWKDNAFNEAIPLTGSAMVIGQDQDTIGGGFEDADAFEGRLTDMYWLGEALDDKEVSFVFNGVNPAEQFKNSVIVGWSDIVALPRHGAVYLIRRLSVGKLHKTGAFFHEIS